MLRDRYGDQIGPYTDLPEDYDQALCHFSYLIEQAIKGQIAVWKVAMVASPPLRNHFVREPFDSDKPNRIIVKGKGNPYNDRDQFLWLMGRLTMDDQVFLCGLENILDELERLIRTDPKSRERLSPLLADVLSNLSLLAELKRQMGLLRPGPPMVEALDLADRQAEFSKKSRLMSRVFGILRNGMKFSPTGTPPSKFNYPSHKKRTVTVAKELQQAESNLDRFWEAVDQHVARSDGKSLHELLAGVLEDRKLQRTPEWHEPDRSRTPTAREPKTRNLADHFSAVDLQERTERTIGPIAISEARPKTKTRGIVGDSKVEAPEHQAEAPDIERIPKFTVSKRGYKTFSTLFYTPSVDEAPGEIPWAEFLSAMASLGFSIKSLDGSAWIFAPVTDLFQRSIIFHEPHPSNKIPYRTARRFGRRLERAYGWRAESFVRG